MKYRNIKRLYDVVDRALFRADSKLSYSRTLEALERLATEVSKTETDCDVWSIGECGNATLDSLIVGAYWFLGDYHGGQGSAEYRVLCGLGSIFSPGWTSGPEDDSVEKCVYEALESKRG